MKPRGRMGKREELLRRKGGREGGGKNFASRQSPSPLLLLLLLLLQVSPSAVWMQLRRRRRPPQSLVFPFPFSLLSRAVHRDDGGEEGRVTTDDEGGGRRKAAHKTTHFCRSPPFYETRTAFVHRLAAEARGEFTQYTVGITYQEEFHPLENWNKYIAGIWRFF